MNDEVFKVTPNMFPTPAQVATMLNVIEQTINQDGFEIVNERMHDEDEDITQGLMRTTLAALSILNARLVLIETGYCIPDTTSV